MMTTDAKREYIHSIERWLIDNGLVESKKESPVDIAHGEYLISGVELVIYFCVVADDHEYITKISLVQESPLTDGYVQVIEDRKRVISSIIGREKQVLEEVDKVLDFFTKIASFSKYAKDDDLKLVTEFFENLAKYYKVETFENSIKDFVYNTNDSSFAKKDFLSILTQEDLPLIFIEKNFAKNENNRIIKIVTIEANFGNYDGFVQIDLEYFIFRRLLKILCDVVNLSNESIKEKYEALSKVLEAVV